MESLACKSPYFLNYSESIYGPTFKWKATYLAELTTILDRFIMNTTNTQLCKGGVGVEGHNVVCQNSVKTEMELLELELFCCIQLHVSLKEAKSIAMQPNQPIMWRFICSQLSVCPGAMEPCKGHLSNKTL